jgi:murein DD-endopeptidase MepM/ murein hydrolase activator NlpD
MGNRIDYSVGAWEKRAANRYDDVVTIQKLLEAAANLKSRPDFDPKGVDGKIARPPKISNTVKAIIAFQSTFLKKPDGLVEPGKKSLRKLNAAAQLEGTSVSLQPMKDLPGDQYFPLPFVPRLSYKTGGRRFGARRSKGTRKHAGCDLVVPKGTKIHATESGTVIRGPYYFYRGTYAIEIKHTHFVARYCEIKGVVKGIRVGTKVKAGQHIAFVGKMWHDSMLHFELYEGSATGPLTQRGKPPYQRRSDLINPAPYLDLWKNNLPA